MKVLFSADWHIKLGQKNVPKEWQINRYKLFYDKIEGIDCDLHIVGGDIFDKLPSLEELELFFEFIVNTKHETLLFDGNHEATKKGGTFLHKLEKAVSYMSKNTCKILTGITTIYDIDIIPYTDLKTFNFKDFTNDILCTHVRGEILPHVHPEIDLNNLERWKVVLAGDLHSHTNSQKNIIYPGSPMTISFHRNEVKNGVILLDTETLEWEWKVLNLPQLIRKTITNIEDMVPTDYNHTVYELEGNISEISNIDRDNTILDKTIIKKYTESSLDLSNKSLSEELDSYLNKVLGIEDTKEYLKVFNDYYKNVGI